MHVLRLLRVGLVASLLAGCHAAGAVPQAIDARSPLEFATGTPRLWYVQAGAGRRDGALQALAMAPHTITVDEGDSITFTDGGKQHTVTFLGRFTVPPVSPIIRTGGSIFDGSNYVSSGLLNPGQQYTLTFTKAGTYAYNCFLNFPEMNGVVVVQPRGTPYPHSQGFYTGSGNRAVNSLLSQAMDSVKNISARIGGATVAAGVSPGTPSGSPTNANVLRFLDGERLNLTTVTVPVNTTVTWVNLSNNDVHTVTIPPKGQPLPNINPFSPGTPHGTYDGTALVNTGPFANPQFKLPNSSVSVKFTRRGTYFYGCLLHHGAGMVGEIIVK